MEELKEFLDKYNIKYTVEGDTVITGDIDLSGNGITKLPELIGNLRCNNLNLQCNKISELPESIGNLRCNILNLCYNKIKELPESIGNLKCNRLNLSHNQISELPESISNIKCSYLNLSNNKISEIPESIGNLKCNNLYLHHNQISVLSESISNIKCNILDLYRNQIVKLPESIGNLKCNVLGLHYNNITKLPESIGNLKCNSLWLSYNQISKLPESFGNIKCNELNLEYNNIIELPKYNKYRFDNIDITDQYINCDGLFRWFNSIKQVGEYTVYIGYNNDYIVTKDNIIFAHGLSIRQAISDLIFKLSDRDKSQYINLDKDSELSIEQAIVMYRVITGACSSGVEWFLQGKDIPETITVNYILGMIKEGDYGYKEFREFFK